MREEIKAVRLEVGGVKDEVRGLNTRLTLMLGGLAILAFLLPVAAPFIRGLLGLPITVP